MEPQGPDTYLNRMLRAARLDSTVFLEVKNDPRSLIQAMGVVILSGLASGVVLGRVMGEVLAQAQMDATLFLLLMPQAALIEWYAETLLLFFIGTRILPEPNTRARYGDLLRALGFASVTGIGQLLVLVPVVSGIARYAVTLWMFAAMVLAVKAVLSYRSTLRAFGVCGMAFLVKLLLARLLLPLLAPGLPS